MRRCCIPFCYIGSIGLSSQLLLLSPKELSSHTEYYNVFTVTILKCVIPVDQGPLECFPKLTRIFPHQPQPVVKMMHETHIISLILFDDHVYPACLLLLHDAPPLVDAVGCYARVGSVLQWIYCQVVHPWTVNLIMHPMEVITL